MFLITLLLHYTEGALYRDVWGILPLPAGARCAASARAAFCTVCGRLLPFARKKGIACSTRGSFCCPEDKHPAEPCEVQRLQTVRKVKALAGSKDMLGAKWVLSSCGREKEGIGTVADPEVVCKTPAWPSSLPCRGRWCPGVQFHLLDSHSSTSEPAWGTRGKGLSASHAGGPLTRKQKAPPIKAAHEYVLAILGTKASAARAPFHPNASKRFANPAVLNEPSLIPLQDRQMLQHRSADH